MSTTNGHFPFYFSSFLKKSFFVVISKSCSHEEKTWAGLTMVWKVSDWVFLSGSTRCLPVESVSVLPVDFCVHAWITSAPLYSPPTPFYLVFVSVFMQKKKDKDFIGVWTWCFSWCFTSFRTHTLTYRQSGVPISPHRHVIGLWQEAGEPGENMQAAHRVIPGTGIKLTTLLLWDSLHWSAGPLSPLRSAAGRATSCPSGQVVGLVLCLQGLGSPHMHTVTMPLHLTGSLFFLLLFPAHWNFLSFFSPVCHFAPHQSESHFKS